MDVKTGVAKLCDLLGQQFHSLSRVAEDDRLIDLQLWRWKEKHGGTPGHGVHTIGRACVVVRVCLPWRRVC